VAVCRYAAILPVKNKAVAAAVVAAVELLLLLLQLLCFFTGRIAA